MRAGNGNAGANAAASGETSRIIGSLNRAARRIRFQGEDDDWASAVLDGALVFSRLAALFRVEGDNLYLERARAAGGNAELTADVRVSIASAPAFRTAVESHDPIVALASPREISELVAEELGFTGAERIALLPLVAESKVAGVLLAAGGNEPFLLDGLELVVTLAGCVLEGRMPPAGANADGNTAKLVTIRGVDA